MHVYYDKLKAIANKSNGREKINLITKFGETVSEFAQKVRGKSFDLLKIREI